MASAISDWLEKALLDHTFNVSAFTASTLFYMALFSGTPGEDGLNNEIAGSGTYGGYVRREVKFANAATLGIGQIVSSSACEFVAATDNWGPVTHAGIFDSAITAAGNCMFKGSLLNARTVNTGETFRFASGDVKASLG